MPVQVFSDESQPVIDALKGSGRVAEIDAQGDVDDIFSHVARFMDVMDGAAARTAAPPPPRTAMTPPRTAEEEARITLDLQTFSEDEIRAVIKIQAAGRGMIARKQAAAVRESFVGGGSRRASTMAGPLLSPPGTAGAAPSRTPPGTSGGVVRTPPGTSGGRPQTADELAASISSLLVICGPSGVGKGTLITRLIEVCRG